MKKVNYVRRDTGFDGCAGVLAFLILMIPAIWLMGAVVYGAAWLFR